MTSNAKVILFGRIEDGEPYRFGRETSSAIGFIPVGFLSTIVVESGEKLYLSTRKGDAGPEFQIAYQTEKNVLGQWTSNLDAVWTNSLSYLEKKMLVSSSDLEILDQDPLLLFAIDDPVTQRALHQLETQPALICFGETPTLPDWFQYLEADVVREDAHRWVFEAFAEAELPWPWRSYKSLGSIVCYVHPQEGTTWRHPLYDYYSRLLTYCQSPSVDREDILLLRVHRLMWTYEVSHSAGGQDAEPLISPQYVEMLADIFGIEISDEGDQTASLVRVLRVFLKRFSAEYREKEDVSRESVSCCVEAILAERERWTLLKENWRSALFAPSPHQAIDVVALASGKVVCVECTQADTPATIYCLDCKDFFCRKCNQKLHAKGARTSHLPFTLNECNECQCMPARVRCAATLKEFCHKCFATVHIKSLSAVQRELPPIRIDYESLKTAILGQLQVDAKAVADTRGVTTKKEETDPAKEEEEVEDDVSFTSAAIASDWHPFYDSKGILYYYNFGTKEKMRRSPVAIESKDEEFEEKSALKNAEAILRKNAETFPNMSKRPGRANSQLIATSTEFLPPHRPRLQQSLHDKLIATINRANELVCCVFLGHL